jgi:hypothetical protein
MAISLKPDQELLIGTGVAAIVYGIFSQGAPNLADVRADEPNMNTYKAVNTAVITATAVVGTLGLLSRSPTVFILGGAMTVFEAWKYHFHNFGGSASTRNERGQIG